MLCYLAGTPAVSITYGKELGLHGFCDADRAGCIDTRCSTTGALVLPHGGAVDWSSTLYNTVAVSTCKAKSQAPNMVVHHVLCMCKLLQDLGLDAQRQVAAAKRWLWPVVVDCDRSLRIQCTWRPTRCWLGPETRGRRVRVARISVH